MQIQITRNDKGNPPGKLADAEIRFTTGPLAGLKLIGFAVWQRRNGAGRNVTFPARQYSVNGARRSFGLLRPMVDAAAQEGIRDLILAAYDADEEQRAITESADEPIGQFPAPDPTTFARHVVTEASSQAARDFCAAHRAAPPAEPDLNF
jgi:hypothetical protein